MQASHRLRRTWLHLAVAGALLTPGLVLVAAPAVGASSQQVYDLTPNGAWITAEGNTWLAQSFTTGAIAPTLSSVRFWVRNANTSNSSSVPSTFNLALHASSGGSPGTKIADISPSSVSVGNFGEEEPTYTSSQSLSASTQYFVVLTGSAGGTIGWKYTAGPPSSSVSPAPTFTAKQSTDGGASWSTISSTAFNMTVTVSVPDPPGAPTAVSGTVGDGQVAVTWTAPSSDGGGAITAYTATASPGGATCTTAATGCTVTGLSNGTAYTFTVAATNAAGPGSASSASSAITPRTVPGAPTALTGTTGDSQVSLTWTAPASTGGSAITGYTATASPGPATCTSVTTSCIVTGLTNGTAYTFTVKATNVAGDSVASTASASITPRGVPGAPTAVTGTAGNQQVSVSWTAPVSNGGSAITTYTATASPGGRTCTASTGTTCTVTSLTNGTAYTFTVKATNIAGDSVASAASAAVTPRTLPGAPTGVNGNPGNKQVSVFWVPPSSTGGSPITNYTVTATPGGQGCSTPGTSCTVTGLTNGSAYTFTVKATNTAGDSPNSTASSSITPRTVPGTPTAVTGAVSNAQVSVSWSAPTFDGGVPITKYTVTATPSGRSCSTASTSCIVTGLINGTSYTFVVVATNDAGDGPASNASASVTPRGVPGAPTAVTGVAGNGQVSLTWTAPLSEGTSDITSYTATAAPGGQDCTTETTSCVISGLTNGNAYTFTVTSTNTAGTGPASTASAIITPRGPPLAPREVIAEPGDGSARVRWSAPASNGGSAITVYRAQSSPGGFSCEIRGGTSCTVVGLKNGTRYTFTVVAVNALGTSTMSTASTVVTPGGDEVGAASATPLQESPSASAEPSDASSLSASPTTTNSATPNPAAADTATTTPGTPGTPNSPTSGPATAGSTETTSEPVGESALPPPGQSILSDTAPIGPKLDLRVALTVGTEAAGKSATVEADGLQPFSKVTLTLYSEPIEIGSGIADERGMARMQTSVPAGLPPGQHTIMALGTGPDGAPVQSVGAFLLDENNLVQAIAPPGQTATPIAPDDESLTRALQSGKPVYDVALFPATTATVAMAAGAVAGLAGAGGITGGGMGGSPGGGGPSGDGQVRGKLAVVPTKRLKALALTYTARGDTSRTWRWPLTGRMDAISRDLPGKFGHFSLLLQRLIIDGVWSRAIFGSLGWLTWVAGAALGGLAMVSTDFTAVPPPLPIILAIIALGILDGAAGAVAWAVMSVGVIVTGNLQGLAGVRSLLGLFVLFATIPLTAHVIRPLRRKPSDTFWGRFDRFADYIMPPIFLAFLATSMFKALNGLSGLEITAPADYGEIRVVVVSAFFLRLIGEDVAVRVYPQRSTSVQPTRSVKPTKAMAWVSVLVRLGIFMLVAEPFFGLGPITYLAAFLTGVPMVLKIYEDDLPNWVWLNKWYPRGVGRFIMILVITLYISAWLLGQTFSSEDYRQAFTFILLPGVISGVLELFGREGWEWPEGWLKRILGFCVWLFAVCVVTGVIVITL